MEEGKSLFVLTGCTEGVMWTSDIIVCFTEQEGIIRVTYLRVGQASKTGIGEDNGMG